MKLLKTLLMLLSLPVAAAGGLVERTVENKDGDTVLVGFHVHDEAVEGRRPGVLMIHQCAALTDYENMRARMLAELGYNVFAADDAEADRRSWRDMRAFFNDIFAR